MVTQIRWRSASLRRRHSHYRNERGAGLRALATNLADVTRAAFDESLRLVLEQHKITLERLPPELDGFRIVQLSDIHLSPLTSRELVERAVETANRLRPDMIVLTGDYVSHEREYVAPCAGLMGRLRARCGVYAVLGNHDHWTDAELVTDLFKLEGIRMLTNEGMRFEHKGASFWLAGVDDTMTGQEDLPLALAGSSADEMKLLLAHNPLVLRRATRAGVDLVLAGHTHGGQINWRSERSASGRIRRRLLRGLGARGATQIYVSRGLGTVVLPFRFGSPPEVTLLELRRS